MKIYGLIVALAMQANFGSAQSSFIPHDVGPGVNSVYDEFNPVISSDGRMLFFTRANHPENTFGVKDSQDIWVSFRSDSTWSTATRVQELNIGRYNAVLSMSEDANTLLLSGIYNKTGSVWKERGLSIVSREGESWGKPVRLAVKKLSKRNRGLKSSASLSADGTLLVLSFSTTYNSKRTDLYISRKRGNSWSRPIPLRKLNTRFNEDAPFLSADNKTMYFASDRKKGGGLDIYKSTRSTTKLKAWTKPVLLGDSINTPAWESYFKTNAAGNTAYFSSTRRPETGADILKVAFFDENRFVIVPNE